MSIKQVAYIVAFKKIHKQIYKNGCHPHYLGNSGSLSQNATTSPVVCTTRAPWADGCTCSCNDMLPNVKDAISLFSLSRLQLLKGIGYEFWSDGGEVFSRVLKK